MLTRALVLSLIATIAGLCGDAPPSVPLDNLPAKLSTKRVPLGLEHRPNAADDARTTLQVALGRRLFFDPILSSDGKIACASCHQPDHGFASVEARPKGIKGESLARRPPTLLNRAFGTSFFWDGRAGTLEDQALEPIANPQEMGSSVEEAVKRLRSHPDFKLQFDAAFEDGVTAKNLAKALASFERTLLRGDSPVDRFRHGGQHEAMTPAERHGFWLYESKGQCWRCHSGPNFSDENLHNTGVSWGRSPLDLGRFSVTKKEEDRGKFKTPTLRGVGLRPPYMHDGSLKTLEEVVEFYNRGGNANPHLSSMIKPLNLSSEDLKSLVAFLKSL